MSLRFFHDQTHWSFIYGAFHRQGQSLEEIIQDLARAKLAYDKAQEEFRDMTALVTVS